MQRCRVSAAVAVTLVLGVCGAEPAPPDKGEGVPTPPPPSTPIPPPLISEFERGAEVIIHDLRSTALRLYNDMRGTVVGVRDGRVGVELPAPHGTKGFLVENVRLLRAHATPAPTPAPEEDTPKVGESPERTARNFTWPLPGAHALSPGMPVALDVETNEDSTQLTTAVVVEVYSGNKDSFRGMWWVRVVGQSRQRLRSAADLRARPGDGLQVKVALPSGDAHGTVLGPPPADFNEGTWIVRINGTVGSKPQYPTVSFKQMTPMFMQEHRFLPGDAVEVKDKDTSIWRQGTVLTVVPMRVKVPGFSEDKVWGEHRIPAPPDTVPDVAVGDQVEVRDSEQALWRLGDVTAVGDSGVKVKVHGWATAHHWRMIRRPVTEAGPPTPAPPPPAPNMTWPINKLVEWEGVCRSATCDNAEWNATLRNETCKDEYVCSNTTGCLWDPLETRPCSRRRLQEADLVILAPGAHEQGSLKGPEVGIIIKDAHDEMPFTVRGPYSDNFHYEENDLLPAWGKDVKWVNASSRSIILSKWLGRPTFGMDAERQEGAVVKPVVERSTELSADWLATPAPAPITPPPTPAPPKPPVVAAVTDPVSVSTGYQTAPVPVSVPVDAATTPIIAAQPIAAVPMPAVIAAPPAVNVAAQVGAGALIVLSPDAQEVSGIYKISGKHRNALLYKSTSCQSNSCRLFVSAGGFWMISTEMDGHTKNKGVVKSSTKGGGKQPHAGFKWEYHEDRKKWTVSEQIQVDTFANMEKKGIPWRKTIEEHTGLDPFAPPVTPAPPAALPVAVPLPVAAVPMPVGAVPMPAGADPNERRLDSDGKAYTLQDFIAYYKGTAEWEKAPKVPPGASFAQASPAGAAGAPATEQFHKGQSVVAVNDIKLGGSFVVRKGSPGVVAGPSGSPSEQRWMVRFMGEFPTPVVVNVQATDIRPG